jgi:hypothetical protein
MKARAQQSNERKEKQFKQSVRFLKETFRNLLTKVQMKILLRLKKFKSVKLFY